MSDDPSRIKDIDLELFKEEKSKCTKPEDDTALITDLCSHCKRLCAASRYYDVLSASKMDEEKKKALLVEFMETVYHSVLDDTAHFMATHSEHLQRVWAEWTEQYGFAKCAVSECAKTSRHYGRGRRDRKDRESGNEEDALYTFYESLFDRFHKGNYVYGCHDIPESGKNVNIYYYPVICPWLREQWIYSDVSCIEQLKIVHSTSSMRSRRIGSGWSLDVVQSDAISHDVTM